MRDTDDPNSSNINTFMTQLLKIEHTKVIFAIIYILKCVITL